MQAHYIFFLTALVCFGRNLQAAPHLSDQLDRQMERIVLDIGSQPSGAKSYRTDVEVKVVGAERQDILRATTSDCRIGHQKVLAKILFNNQTEIQALNPSNNVQLAAQIDVPTNAIGSLTCDKSLIMLNATPLAEILMQGELIAPPAWRDANDTEIYNLDFSFASQISGTPANVNVDSTPQFLKLSNAIVYPANVNLTRPRGCRIGTTTVNNVHVHLVYNGLPITSNQTLVISTGVANEFRMRFAAAGGYRTASGAVFCNSYGSLSYTY